MVLDHGKGAWVWDIAGQKYLDFTAGIAVNALGHGDKGVVEVRKNSMSTCSVKCVLLQGMVGRNIDAPLYLV